jgi:hypothetical protein
VRREARLNLLVISEKKRGKILNLNSTSLLCISNKYYSTQIKISVELLSSLIN